MTDQAHDDDTAGTSIAILVEHEPQIVLLDEKSRAALFEHINGEIAAYEYDLSTVDSRKKAISFAAKITKTKTAAVAAAAKLTEEARKVVAEVNGARKVVVDTLDEMAQRARQPVTDWEAAEKNRVTECEAAIRDLTSMSVVPLDASADQVQQAIAAATAREIDPARFQGMTEAAIKARNHTLEVLNAALARIRQQEEERAELARLREEAARRAAEEEARSQREAAEREAREAEERTQREQQEAAAQAERDALAAQERAMQEEAAAAERERQAAEAAAARAAQEERVRAEAEAAAERERVEAAQAAVIAEERRQREEADTARRQAEERAAAAEREAEAQRQRIAEAEAARAAAAAEEAERQRKLEADKAHRTLCKREAKEALMTVGMSEDQAQKAVLLIISGEVPRVSLDWSAVVPEKQEAVEQPALV